MPFINEHEHQRLQAQARAWEAVWQVLIDCNPECFRAPVNGLECAVNEIKRMHKASKRVPGKAITIAMPKDEAEVLLGSIAKAAKP